MQVLFFCPRWGHSRLSWEDFCRKATAAGYDGIETDVPDDEREKQRLLEALAKYNLQLAAQHWETAEANFHQHKILFQKKLESIAAANPLFINTHTGRDFFLFKQNKQLIVMADEISQRTGIPVYHETHRGRFGFAAHVVAAFLNEIPFLQLTLDISHWITVAETYLQDQQTAVQQAVERTRHIHARVGHTQGAQVPDPRIPEWQQALNVHLLIWDKAVESNRQQGADWLGITPEFGPVPYMPLKSNGEPAADQWEINCFMMELLRNRYQQNETFN